MHQHHHHHDHSDHAGHHHDHDHHGHACTHGPLDQHDPGHDAICVERVSYRYGNVQALSNVSLHVAQGCVLGVIGPNGGGKTTLLKILLGQLRDYEGKVRVMGRPPEDVAKRGDIIGYVPQHHGFERRFPVSVRQVVRMGLVGKTGLLRRYRREDLERVETLLQQVGMAHLAERPIGDLSGGQQQRAFIARALASGPKILLMDEPTVGIDVAGQQQFADLIHRLHEQLGLTVMIVSHDLRSVASSCEKVACLARTVHFHDAPEGLTPALLQEVFQHEIAALTQ